MIYLVLLGFIPDIIFSLLAPSYAVPTLIFYRVDSTSAIMCHQHIFITCSKVINEIKILSKIDPKNNQWMILSNLFSTIYYLHHTASLLDKFFSLFTYLIMKHQQTSTELQAENLFTLKLIIRKSDYLSHSSPVNHLIFSFCSVLLLICID